MQMEEAFAASLTLQDPSSSSSDAAASSSRQQSPANSGRDLKLDDLEAAVWDKLEQERRDRDLSGWEEFGDELETPSGEGSSSGPLPLGNCETYRLYFKGLVSEERVGGSKVALCGIGVAICDPKDNLIFELKKPIKGIMSRQAADAKALLEGLEIAFSLDLKRIIFFCDYRPIYQYAEQRWHPKQRKIAALMDKVAVLKEKFAFCHSHLVPRFAIKHAFKLARDAIESEVAKPTHSNRGNNLKETCTICLEETNTDQMFRIVVCLHTYCFSCMKQHVEVKLLHGVIPNCPHEGCTSELSINSCEKFLTPKLNEMMKQRLKEASVPTTEKVYCPFPRCSELMSKSQASEFATKEAVHFRNFGGRKCVKCCELFCINCKVPWHHNMTCTEYKRLHPLPADDSNLNSLASRNLWRQCVKCNHMIELTEGCYHMTCRCGHEFCYTCGAAWNIVGNEKNPTCSCPLFDDDDEDEDDDDDDDDDEGNDEEVEEEDNGEGEHKEEEEVEEEDNDEEESEEEAEQEDGQEDEEMEDASASSSRARERCSKLYHDYDAQMDEFIRQLGAMRTHLDSKFDALESMQNAMRIHFDSRFDTLESMQKEQLEAINAHNLYVRQMMDYNFYHNHGHPFDPSWQPPPPSPPPTE